jgi:diguanylate cyclase (GGDEF)-like protein
LVAATGVAVVVHASRARLLVELAQARDVAAAAAVRDNLTGLANRRGLAMLGAQIVETARRQGDAVHCVFLDLDGFRVVNETLGRETGDEVLVAVADVLRAATRSTDVVARWGGDEFCIVGPGPAPRRSSSSAGCASGLLSQPPVPTDTWEPRVSAGGAMLAPWDSGTLDTLLGKADQEMYLRRAVRREVRRCRRGGSRANRWEVLGMWLETALQRLSTAPPSSPSATVPDAPRRRRIA